MGSCSGDGRQRRCEDSKEVRMRMGLGLGLWGLASARGAAKTSSTLLIRSSRGRWRCQGAAAACSEKRQEDLYAD
jgi:soluble lytic murein transglycosylase-like protein